VANGLKFTFKGNLDKDAGDLGVEYTKGGLHLTGEMDVIKLTKMNASGCAKVGGGICVGGKAGYSFKTNALTGYDVGASYSQGPVFAALQTSDKLSTANLSLHYAVNSDLKIATSSSHSASAPLGSFWLGASMASGFGTAKGKFSSDGLVRACLVRELSNKVTATPSVQLAASNLSSMKWGIGCQIG